MPDQSKAFPPLYLLVAGETCPACGQATNVYALMADSLYDASEDGTFPGPLVLKDIERLPGHTLALLRPRCPTWEFDKEQTDQSQYLMNHCHRCTAKLTDFYLHAEPGSAFYPCGPDECYNIDLFAIPETSPVPLVCAFTAGGLTEWLDYDAAKPLTEL